MQLFKIGALMLAGWLFGGLEVQAGDSFYEPLPAMKHPADNPFSKEKEALGKMLYFDPRLSGSNWISCATCHNPALGWGDGLKRAIGNGQTELGRHSPTIINSGYFESQFWDGRAKTLEEQALGPIQAAGEMNQNMDELILELKAIPGYASKFKKVFGDTFCDSHIGPTTFQSEYLPEKEILRLKIMLDHTNRWRDLGDTIRYILNEKMGTPGFALRKEPWLESKHTVIEFKKREREDWSL